MENELIENKLELRKLNEDIISGTVSSTEGKLKLEELRAKKADIEKRIALKNAPIKTADSKNSTFTEIRKAMETKRSIVLNGTGAINQISELVKELQTKAPLLQMVRYFYGPNAGTNIPIFSPTLAAPSSYGEGASAIAKDTNASLGSKTLTPYAL